MKPVLQRKHSDTAIIVLKRHEDETAVKMKQVLKRKHGVTAIVVLKREEDETAGGNETDVET